MRPSQKSGRGRGKGNRSSKNNNQGHSPNRVYDSAGPEGKVRGTPQQIVDKYQSLARDAQLSGDRVTAENFLQHAEHYVRILSAVQEAEEKRREQQQQHHQNQQNNNQNAQQNVQQNGGGEQPSLQPSSQRNDEQSDGRRSDNRREDTRRDDRSRDSRRRNSRHDAPPVDVESDLGEQPASDGLAALDAVQSEAPEIVDTPETQAKPRTRRPRPKAPEKTTEEPAAEAAPDDVAQAVEAPKKRAPRTRKVAAVEPEVVEDAPADKPVQEAS